MGEFDRHLTVTALAPAQALRLWRQRASLPELRPGWVWLVGAGPGDAAYLTLAAIDALAQADAVFFDALVDESVLGFAAPGAQLVDVGKRGGVASVRQAEITALLIARARAGQRIVRLKGGDPYIFGRGAEEALALADAGIPFRVVPGVTAGLGGLGVAGIPLTHRDINQAVTFITGHDAQGRLPGTLDWEALAKGAPVLVVYMGLKHRQEIARRLLEAGRAPGEAAAVVSAAGTPGETVMVLTLAEMAEPLPVEPPGPAMLVFGEVVRLREPILAAQMPELQALAAGAHDQ